MILFFGFASRLQCVLILCKGSGVYVDQVFQNLYVITSCGTDFSIENDRVDTCFDWMLAVFEQFERDQVKELVDLLAVYVTDRYF